MNSADTPWADDPPINALSMLEVAVEAHGDFEARKKAATDYMRRAAIRALLDGHPPREVMEACGFEYEAPRVRSQVEDDMNDIYFLGYTERKTSQQFFLEWLGKGLKDLLTDA